MTWLFWFSAWLGGFLLGLAVGYWLVVDGDDEG